MEQAQSELGSGLSLPVQRLEHGDLLFWLLAMDLQVYTSSLILELAGYGLVDSGTSLLLLPPTSYEQTVSALTKATDTVVSAEGLVPCDAELNHLVLHFFGPNGHLDVSLDAHDLLLTTGSEQCKLGIDRMKEDEELPHMVLGDIFFRKVRVIFDLKMAQVTLTPLAPLAAPLAAPLMTLTTPLLYLPAVVLLCSCAACWRKPASDYRELPGSP